MQDWATRHKKLIIPEAAYWLAAERIEATREFINKHGALLRLCRLLLAPPPGPHWRVVAILGFFHSNRGDYLMPISRFTVAYLQKKLQACNLQRALVITMTLIPIYVIAATTWPFVVANFFPGRTFSEDADLDYLGAKTIPRMVMNVSVQNIKKGDTIRMIYADGVYDFEVLSRCPAVAPCPLANPIKVDTPTSPALPTNYRRAVARQEAMEARQQIYCSGGVFGQFITISVPTGYWSTIIETATPEGQVFTGTYLEGAPLTYTVSVPSLPPRCR